MSKTFADFGITDLRGGSAERVSTCPQCSSARRNKRAKCLSVNVEKECWVCHHCGWTGSLKKGVDNTSNPYLWKPKTYTKPVFVPQDPEAQMLGWFAQRGITEAVVRRNQIRRDVVYMPQPEEEVPVICFPFCRSGQVVNIKYRDQHKNFRGVAGAERIFYGLDDIDDITYIVEGEMDKLSLEEAGYKNCISVPDGAPSPEAKDYSSKFEFLENCKDEIEKVQNFVLAVDNDAPGQVLEEELARRLGKERCLRVIWPEGCKDANEVLMKHGVEKLQECLSTLYEFPLDGVIEVSKIHDRVMNLYRNGQERGTHPGWEYMAAHYTVKEGQMTIVTGIPQHGKSEWLDALLVNLAKNHDWVFGIYSPENHPIEQHVGKLCEKYQGKPFRDGPTSRMTEAECEKATGWVGDHFVFLGTEEDAFSLDEILDKAKELVFRRGIKGLVLDPWNELDHHRPANLTETEYISKCLTRIRYFARTNSVHVWIVAHPTKLVKEQDAKGKTKYPVPTPYDISGSAHWFNKADNAISVWRDVSQPGSPTHIYLQKIKFKHIGKLGRVLMDYDISTGRYKECRIQEL
jgi:twinkle protein